MCAEESVPANSSTVVSVGSNPVDKRFDEDMAPIHWVVRAGNPKLEME
jgi:hypothetical protein